MLNSLTYQYIAILDTSAVQQLFPLLQFQLFTAVYIMEIHLCLLFLLGHKSPVVAYYSKISILLTFWRRVCSSFLPQIPFYVNSNHLAYFSEMECKLSISMQFKPRSTCQNSFKNCRNVLKLHKEVFIVAF